MAIINIQKTSRDEQRPDASPPPLPASEQSQSADLPNPPASGEAPPELRRSDVGGGNRSRALHGGLRLAAFSEITEEDRAGAAREGGNTFNYILSCAPSHGSDIQLRTDTFVRFHTKDGLEMLAGAERLTSPHMICILLALLRSRSVLVQGNDSLSSEDAMIARLLKQRSIDFAVEGGNALTGIIEKVCRLRVQAFFCNTGLGITARILRDSPAEICELGFSSDTVASMKSLILKRSGLCLVTGPTGSGKTTTLAALVDWARANHSRHTVTIEEPIEYRYSDVGPDGEPSKGFVTQQEVGTDVHSFKQGLIDGLRKCPHIILVGEIRDAETIETAFQAAMTGHLVLGTMHTQSASRTIARILDLFPPVRAESVLNQLADNIQFILSQGLLTGLQLDARVLAYEYFVNAGDDSRSAIRKYLTENALLEGAIGRRGNLRWNDCIKQLLVGGKISTETSSNNTFGTPQQGGEHN